MISMPLCWLELCTATDGTVTLAALPSGLLQDCASDQSGSSAADRWTIRQPRKRFPLSSRSQVLWLQSVLGVTSPSEVGLSPMPRDSQPAPWPRRVLVTGGTAIRFIGGPRQSWLTWNIPKRFRDGGA